MLNDEKIAEIAGLLEGASAGDVFEVIRKAREVALQSADGLVTIQVNRYNRAESDLIACQRPKKDSGQDGLLLDVFRKRTKLSKAGDMP